MRNEPQVDVDVLVADANSVLAVDGARETDTATATMAVPTEVVEAAAMMREQAVTALAKTADSEQLITFSQFKDEINLESDRLFRDPAHKGVFETVISCLFVMYKKSTALDLRLGLNSIRVFISELKAFLEGSNDAEYSRRATLIAGTAENGGKLEKYLNMSSRNGFRSADQIIYNVKRDIQTFLNPPKEPERVVIESKPLTEGQKTLKQLRFEVAALRRKLEVLDEQGPTTSSVRDKLSKKEHELARLEEKEAGQNPTKPSDSSDTVSVTA